MSTPLVSVVIPVYNGERFLAAAIDSVIGQSYQPIEIILVDDGSADGSWRLIESYGSKVTAIRQTNQGVARARNSGILLAHGEFVAFLDQDDWWHLDKVGRQVRVFLNSARVGLVHTGVSHYDEVTAEFARPLNPDSRPQELTGNCYDRLLLGNCVHNSSVMVRKSVLDAVGMFDTEICGNTVQDYDLWLRFAEQSTFAYVPEKLLVYRLHPGQGLWNRRQMLTQELRLLQRRMKHSAAAAPTAFDIRLAALWYDLGIAHLNASECDVARRCFSQSIHMRWSTRTSALYIASWLPQWMIDLLRRRLANLRRSARRDSDSTVPAWVEPR